MTFHLGISMDIIRFTVRETQLAAVALLAVLYVGNTTLANEAIRNESPAPASAKQTETSLDYAFTDRPLTERSVWTGAKEALSDKDAFWRDTRLFFDTRSYVFRRRNAADDRPEDFVIGGKIVYESGWWNNLSIRAAYYNSTELSSSGGNTGLLADGHENISAVGEANLRYRFTSGFLNGAVARLGRQSMSLPYINKHDIRQVPAAHEAYTLERANVENTKVNWIVGHVLKFKDYDSDSFEYMSESAGAFDSDEGVTVAGARYKPSGDVSIGAANYYGWDTYNTFFAEGTYHRLLGANLDMKLAAQFSDQRSVGDELVGDFDTQQLAAKATFGYQGLVVKGGFSLTSDDAAMRKDWGGSPSYLSMMRLDFDRAGETAYMLSLSYNDEFWTSLGLSGWVSFTHGTNAEDAATGLDLPDRTEYDITVDYKPPGGFLEGLWVRARYNFIDTEGDNTKVYDFRLIVNYSLPFL